MRPELWVVAESFGEEIAPITLELLGKGQELASQSHGMLAAVSLEERHMELLAHAGAQKVYLIETEQLDFSLSTPWALALAELARKYPPEVVLFPATDRGTEVASRLAARLSTGLTAHCLELSLEEVEGKLQLIQVVAGWGGNLALRILCPHHRPQIATVRPGVFEWPKLEPERRAEIVRFRPTPPPSRQRLLSVEEAPRGQAPLEEAPVVAAGGWGLYCAGAMDEAKRLCSLLKAPLAATRPMVDKGLLPQEQMLGHSGKTIAPKLLISLGASGAIHFTSGFLRARTVLAVDKNPNAPIFQACDVGIVGDLAEVLPLLVEEIEDTLHGKG